MAAAVSVNVGAVLEALAEQRGEAGVAATTLNLIVFVEDPRALERVLQRVQTIAHKHPCRAILLDATQSGGTPSVRCESTQHDETLQTHTELVQLNVAGIGAVELRSMAHELLVPNVETLLFWAGKHLTDERFETLARSVKSAVIDSARARSGKAALRELLEAGPRIHWAIRDLAFMRLLPWQDMIAQFFDDAQLAAELPSISRVETVTGSEPEAYYLLGWLASRLGWQPCGASEFCNSAGDKVGIEMRIEGEPRRVRSVRLRSANCVFTAGVDDQAEDLVCLTVTGSKQRTKRCVPLHDVDFLSLVEQAILVPRNSGIFIESIEMVRRLLAAEPAS